MYDCRDKIVLVTGGAAGIGAGLVKTFLHEGAAHVAALDVDIHNGEALEKQLNQKYGGTKVKFHKCDITTSDLEAAYDGVLKEFGYIDIVVNCAGIMNDMPHMYMKQIEVNVSALIKSSLKAFDLMRKDHGGKGGTIINISSVMGLFQATSLPVYCATKSAVLQFSNCLGMEPNFGRSGVRVLTLCFGSTDTSLLSSHKIGTFDKESQEELHNIAKIFPIQKPESAIEGVLYAFKHGASASTWLVTSGRKTDISENIKKAYQIMGQGIYN